MILYNLVIPQYLKIIAEVMKLYGKLAAAITNKLSEWEIIDNNKYEIYVYSFEVLISYFVFFVVFLLMALLTQTFFESICYLVGFCILRHYAGGYHAATYLRCHLLFSFTHLLFIFICKNISSEWNYIVFFSLTLYVLSSVFIFAPVDNVNKPFTEREFFRYRIKSRLYAVALSIILSVIFMLLSVLQSYALCYIIGTSFAATSLWVAKTITSYSNRTASVHTLDN